MIADLTKKDRMVESLSSLNFNNEPTFAQEFRNNAKEALTNLDFPTTKEEYWKYTRVGKIINKTYTTQQVDTVDITPYLIPNLDANILVLVNGFYIKSLSQITTQEGVTVSALSQAKNSSNESFNKHFGAYSTCNKEVFLVMNNAFHTDGIFIEAAKNTVAEKPYHIINITTQNNVIAQSRNLIIGNIGAQVKVIESFVNLSGNENFVNNATEIFVGENANVEYNKIQDKENDNYHISSEQVYQEANSNFTINTATFNGAIVRNNLNIVVDASNCETNLSGLYLGKNNDHIDNHTVVDHKQPHCNSNEVYKGVLDDKSTGVFNGKVFVRQAAQITNAFQQNNNILLSDDANVNSKPELEIYADDVKCSHGSTTGQIDEEAIFYLQSRGISKRNAINLMINAFAKDALENISIEALAEYVDAKIEERFTK